MIQRGTTLPRYKVTFGRGSAPYLATLPTILSEEEEFNHGHNNNNMYGAVNRNQMNSASSDTMALSAEEVEEVVRLVEGEVEAHQQLRNGGFAQSDSGKSSVDVATIRDKELKLEYRLSQLPIAPETELV